MMYRTSVAVFALTALSLVADEGQPAVTFHSGVSLVRVDAQVVDSDNRPIRGLQMDDFVLRQGGQQQEVRHMESEKLPVDVILLLDVSRSMEPHVERIASAAHEALSVLGDKDRIAVLVFDRRTRVRMAFSNSREDAERALEGVVDQEAFNGGTDITKGLLDAAHYMAYHARHDARRAIVILTDDQTELNRDDASVVSALKGADTVLSALIAPDALHTGSTPQLQLPHGLEAGSEFDEMLGELRAMMMRSGMPAFGPHTKSAGTSEIARESGGDSMAVENASAFKDTMARIREQYGLYFYLPEGAKPDDESSIEVALSDAARQRYPGTVVRFRLSHLAPEGSAAPAPASASPLPG